MMLCRERRSWTAKEDQLLRDAVQKEDPGNQNPSKWHAIAKHVPNRTNKDCRKRWFAKMASDVVKGGWAPDEDEKLVNGIAKYGTRWSLVASVVQSRNSDQCAKRWTDTLNPSIDRTTWTVDQDELLVQAVNEHGKVWTKIVKTYFPGRTGLSAKNRYNSITRFSGDHSRSARSRRRSPDTPYTDHRKSESVSSSSSSACVSPATPAMSIPEINSTLIPSSTDSLSNSYIMDRLTGWSSSSSSGSADDLLSFNPLFSGLETCAQIPYSMPSTPSLDPSYLFEANMNQALSAFPDESHIMFPSLPSAGGYNSHFIDHSRTQGGSNIYSHQSQHSLPSIHAMSSQQSLFEGLQLPNTDRHMGVTWQNSMPPLDSKHWENMKAMSTNELYMF